MRSILTTIIVIFISLTIYSQNIFFDYDIKEPTKIYYKNGKLKEIGLVSEGKRVGKWVFYSEKGIKLAQCCFNNLGQKHGVWLVWDNNSKLRAKMIYRNGIRKGKWEVYDDHGKLTIRKYY